MSWNHEKRKSRRTELRVPVYVMHGDESYPAEGVDVSLAGISVASRRRPPVGDMCEIEILAKQPIYVRALVRRHTSRGFAASNVLIDPEAHGRLRRLVRTLERQAA